MGLLDFFNKTQENPLGDQRLNYSFRKAEGPDSVDGKVASYSLKRKIKGNKVIDRYFEIPVDDEDKSMKDIRNVFCFSPGEYNSISKSIDDNSFKEEYYRKLLRHHKDSNEENGLIVKIMRNDKTKKYEMSLLGKVIRVERVRTN
jgi:hypothetical protein